MKACKSCGKEFTPKSKINRYCCNACKVKGPPKPCHRCQVEFIPKDRRNIFCSRHCAVKWMHTQPDIVRRMIAGKDLEAIARNISKEHLSNRSFLEGRKKWMASNGERIRKMHKPGSPFAGTYKTPRAELIMAGLFPEAQHNFKIPTGTSAKLGHAQVYYLDFAWPDVKLDVELDGSYHSRPEQQKKDSVRNRFLEERGWCVLRFLNRQVIRDSTKVQEVIESTISRLKATQVTA